MTATVVFAILYASALILLAASFIVFVRGQRKAARMQADAIGKFREAILALGKSK